MEPTSPQAPRADVIVGPFNLPNPIGYEQMWNVFQNFLQRNAPPVARGLQSIIDEENRTTARYDTAGRNIQRRFEEIQRENMRQRFLESIRNNPGGPITITGGR